MRVKTGHRGGGDDEEEFVIDHFSTKDSKAFTFRGKIDGTEKIMSIYDYFQKKYNLRLSHPDWPVIVTTKKNIAVPIEILTLLPNQRFLSKLDDKATSAMIKIAVTPPKDRWAAVSRGLDMLGWQSDPYLKNYGLQLDTKPVVVKGRLLPAPEVTFANGANKPGTSGRWDVRGKKFLQSNPKPLKSWGVCVLPDRYPPDKNAISHCMNELIKVYAGHGGKVENRTPVLHLASGPNPAKAVEELWNKTGNANKLRPQLLIFVVPDKTAITYGRIKKSCECRYGVVSQVMNMQNVVKAQGQYLSNVCLKINAKLGGATAKATSAQSKGPYGLFKVPTMVFGIDVSHAAPGMDAPSMAAITASMDHLCTRYAGACNSNGYRLEQISPANMNKLMKPLIQHWVQNVNDGRFPKRIIYFRDGVSESQFDMVVKNEIMDLKNLLASANAKHDIMFTVMVATKRHHIRFFPKDDNKDRNGNPLPGTLIETGATHPREWDFFLNSHAAIKGTARPTHYHVLMNEDGGKENPALTPDALYQFCYEHVYQYCRATTPVSLPPAVYYAHLLSKRAVHHDVNFGNASNERESHRSGSDSGSKGSKSKGTASINEDVPDLLSMPNDAGINTTMWYV